MLSPCSCPRSPVSGVGGGGRACGEGGRKASGRCGAGGARRPGSCRCDSPGLLDYSVRHASRRTTLRGEWCLGFCGASSRSRCGPRRVVEAGQQQWGAFSRPPYGCGSTIPARPNWEKNPQNFWFTRFEP